MGPRQLPSPSSSTAWPLWSGQYDELQCRWYDYDDDDDDGYDVYYCYDDGDDDDNDDDCDDDDDDDDDDDSGDDDDCDGYCDYNYILLCILGSSLVSGSTDCSVRIWDLKEVYHTAVSNCHDRNNKYNSYDTTSSSKTIGGINFSNNNNNLINNTTSTSINNNNNSSNNNNNNNVNNSRNLVVPPINNSNNNNNQIHSSALLPPPSIISTNTTSSPSIDNHVPQLILRPLHSFYTKFTSVYYVGYTAKNLIYAGMVVVVVVVL